MAYNLLKRVKKLERQSPKPVPPLIISLWDSKCESGGFEGYKALIDGESYRFHGTDRDDVIDVARERLPCFYEPRLIELYPI